MTTKAFINGYLAGERVVLLYRDAVGLLTKKTTPAEHVTYHPLALAADSATSDAMLRDMRTDPRVVGVAQEGDYWRTRWRDRWGRKDAVRAMRQNGVPVLEGDVNPLKRLVADLGLGIAPPRRLLLDIEVDSRKTFAEMREGQARLLSWAAIDDAGDEHSMVLADWSDAAERELLDAFWRLAADNDQLVAWSGRFSSETFDFVVLEQRSKRLGALPDWPLEAKLWLDHHDVFERMNKNAAESGAEKQSLKLGSVSVELLGVGKDDLDPSKTYEAWEEARATGDVGYGKRAADAFVAEAFSPLRRYNATDVRRMAQIEEKTGYIALFQTLCEACRVFPNSYSLFPTVQMDGFLLRLGVERGYRFPTKHYDKEEPDASFVEPEQFRGAYVLHPTEKGVVHDVHVFDFASMYPSIIVALNISLETKLGRLTDVPECGPTPFCTAPLTDILFSTKEQGILAFAVAEMVRLRQYWKKKQAALPPNTPEWVDAGRRSNAYKVAANSFFGASGNKYCRFYDREVAESISTTGAWLLRQVIDEATRRGIVVVYGDTDAGNCIGVTRDRFKEFVRHCNEEFLPRILREIGARPEGIEIDNEKGFVRVVWLAAKKYVAKLAYYKGKDADATTKPEVKGLEWKRGDANLMARQLQSEAIGLFCDDARYLEAAAYRAAAECWKAKVLTGALSIDEVKMSASLGKKLDDYVVKEKKGGGKSAEPAHVRVARLLKEKGADIGEGTRIDYYMADHLTRDVRSADDFAGECDRFYLWEKKVYPPTERLLAALFPAEDWKALGKARPPKERKRGITKDVAAAPRTTPPPSAGVAATFFACMSCASPIQVGVELMAGGTCATCKAPITVCAACYGAGGPNRLCCAEHRKGANDQRGARGSRGGGGLGQVQVAPDGAALQRAAPGRRARRPRPAQEAPQDPGGGSVAVAERPRRRRGWRVA